MSDVDAGYFHSCAIREADGRPFCWGINGIGQLNVPGGVPAAVEISVGDYNSCMLGTDGRFYCWGSNSYGQSSPP